MGRLMMKKGPMDSLFYPTLLHFFLYILYFLSLFLFCFLLSPRLVIFSLIMMFVEGAVIRSLDFNLSPSMYHLCLRCRRDCSFNLLWVKKKIKKMGALETVAGQL